MGRASRPFDEDRLTVPSSQPCQEDDEGTSSTGKSRSMFAWLRPIRTYANRKQRKSQYYGWKWGILMGVVVGACILTLNLVLIAIVIRKESERGIFTLLAAKEDKVFRVNLGLHIVINVCSTLLLGASNYGMQVLCSPTRSDYDRLHRERKTLDVGILSMSNLRNITGLRRWLCVALAVSSLPIHLFYNASVYQVGTLAEYTVNVFNSSSESVEQQIFTSSESLKQLTLSELKIAYDEDKADVWRDVTLIVDGVKLTITHYDARWYAKGLLAVYENGSENVSSNLEAVFGTIRAQLRAENGTSTWIETLDDGGWLKATYTRDPRAVVPNMSHPPAVPAFVHVKSAYARPKPDRSRISLSLPLIYIVTVCNTIKVVVLLFVLLGNTIEPPLVTVGDTICSFLADPDVYTADYRNYCREEFERLTPVSTHELASERTEKRPESTAWKPTIRRYGLVGIIGWLKVGSSATGREHLVSVWVALALIGSIVAISFIRPGPWGTASQQRYNFANALDGSRAAALSVIVNTPQLILSIITMDLEYSPKPFRVSKPMGNQRGTYFLQLPYRWAIPLSLTSGILHWLLSQTIFLVRKDRVDPDGNWDKADSISACGVSGSALLAFCALAFTVHTALDFVGSRKFIETVPYEGPLTWVISAACHPPADESDPPLDEVGWGVVSVDNIDGNESSEYSFSENAMIVAPQTPSEPVPVLYKACRQSRRTTERVPCRDRTRRSVEQSGKSSAGPSSEAKVSLTYNERYMLARQRARGETESRKS